LFTLFNEEHCATQQSLHVLYAYVERKMLILGKVLELESSSANVYIFRSALIVFYVYTNISHITVIVFRSGHVSAQECPKRDKIGIFGFGHMYLCHLDLCRALLRPSTSIR
jgi:hypothetical protein